ncbi:gamma-glutamyl-gamma-aminobutyrate hydrolase family protein [Streptomyces polyrhachis]|uniref:Gamma-glutamyl-gamma-aminobutyrate hydrolase family protein n=1 Tax=Streptomyces polyrhachis TaxID=1282885 RepID=A0ABW2GAY0_9ACTN
MVTPVIGISMYLEQSARWGDWEMPAVLLPAAYVHLVQQAGGRAVLLPADVPEAAAEVLAGLDGVIVAGGGDVAPERYGARRDPRTGPADPQRDAWELALVEGALAYGLPLLGICRGMQLLNVACGGTLLQHLDGHRGPAGRMGEHVVTPLAGTRLAEIFPAPTAVPTYHHQAVDVLAPRLTASARAQDGTVEAVELAGPVFTLGVQWHPEMGADTRLAEAFIRATARPGTPGPPAVCSPAAGSPPR